MSDAKSSDCSTEGRGLNLDHDEARAIHRVIRAMHDGECPKCHRIHDAGLMLWVTDALGGDERFERPGWKCPSCDFSITHDEARDGLQRFATFMDRNLAIFEAWRESRAVFNKERKCDGNEDHNIQRT